MTCIIPWITIHKSEKINHTRLHGSAVNNIYNLTNNNVEYWSNQNNNVYVLGGYQAMGDD